MKWSHGLEFLVIIDMSKRVLEAINCPLVQQAMSLEKMLLEILAKWPSQRARLRQQTALGHSHSTRVMPSMHLVVVKVLRCQVSQGSPSSLGDFIMCLAINRKVQRHQRSPPCTHSREHPTGSTRKKGSRGSAWHHCIACHEQHAPLT